MYIKNVNYTKVKNKYLNFLKSQEVLTEPFRDKIGQLNKFYLPISNQIFKNFLKNKKTKIIGLTGGQGSGKSTISNILKIILREKYKLNTITFSIDDFYKTRLERKKMAKNVSSLFLTRGVPGTHDVKLLNICLKKLKNSNFKKILIPKFDKSIDDRLPKKKWQKILTKPDVVIFEGWCVGVKPQKNRALMTPVNNLERIRDKNRIWRNRVNKELKNNYKKIFDLIDNIIFLKVPSFDYVYKWRLLQEQKLRSRTKGKKTMNDEQIKNFIMFYERLTKHMFKTSGLKANIIIKIDRKHKLKSIELK